MSIPNVLADRYSSAEMTEIFDNEYRVRLERQFWIEVLKSQISLGLDVEDTVIADYEAAVDTVDLDSIREREKVTRHDVPARLHEFNDLAGHQHAHKGMTSRDLTENVEQLLSLAALRLVESRTVSLLSLLAEKCVAYESLAVVGRTHNVPAQPTTVGKRFAQITEELLHAHKNLQSLIENFSLRGLKGPVGSQQDQVSLLGSADKAVQLEHSVAARFGVQQTLTSVGQVYPRVLDYEVGSVLLQLGSGPSNLALLVRLMASHDLATEGFQPGQVGSSAMPHKMNARSCERVNGLFQILQGYVSMSAALAGSQWNEGDVSCSVVRRVSLPNSFLALDGLYETTFAVLREFAVFDEVISSEIRKYLPFLSSTTLLMHAVKNGVGREDAHELIKSHAVETALDMRRGVGDGSALLTRLGGDSAFPGSEDELTSLVSNVEQLLGAIPSQIAETVAAVNEVVSGREDTAYRGADIL